MVLFSAKLNIFRYFYIQYLGAFLAYFHFRVPYSSLQFLFGHGTRREDFEMFITRKLVIN